jgi:hypothetical protein
MINTTVEQINGLKHGLEEFTKSREKDYKGSNVTIDSFASDNIRLAVNVDFKCNWQEGSRNAKLRNDFLFQVKLLMESLQIQTPQRNRSIPLDDCN